VNIDSVQKALEQVQNIKSGKMNYTIHKANWCGYCVKLMDQLTRLMKEFNKAGKRITIQISTVDEEHSDMYNNVRQKNGLPRVDVASFPTIMSEQTNGSSNETNASKMSQDELIERVNSTVTTGNPVSPVSSIPMSMAPGSPVASANPEAASANAEPGLISASPIAPPSLQADEIGLVNNGNNGNPTSLNNNNPKPPQIGGYGLYPAIASTAYHLAPAGILLAAAAATFKCRKGKGRKNRSRKGRR
jgi:thiol-disulfide isomerase/thioredoxin